MKREVTPISAHSQVGPQPRAPYEPGHALPSSPRGRWPRPKPIYRHCLEENLGKPGDRTPQGQPRPHRSPAGHTSNPHPVLTPWGSSWAIWETCQGSHLVPSPARKQVSAPADMAQSILVASEGSSTWQAGTRCAQGLRLSQQGLSMQRGLP